MLTDAQIQEGNRLIVEFLTGEKTKRSDLDYHFDWNWIMPIFQKIMDMQNEDNLTFDVQIGRKSVYWKCYMLVGDSWIIESFYHIIDGAQDCKSLIECYYKNIIEFITWYKNNKV